MAAPARLDWKQDLLAAVSPEGGPLVVKQWLERENFPRERLEAADLKRREWRALRPRVAWDPKGIAPSSRHRLWKAFRC